MTATAKTTVEEREMVREMMARIATEAREWLAVVGTTAHARPLADRVLVMMLDEPTQEEAGGITGGRKDEKSGLWLAEEHRKMYRALVLAVSDKVKEPLRKGDCVIIGEHVGMPLPELDDFADLRLVKEHDILAVFVPEDGA